MKCEVTAYGKVRKLTLTKSKYGNGRIAILAMEEDGSQWGMLTVNFPDAELEEKEIVVKDYSENESWVPQVLTALSEYFEDTGKKVHSGFVSASIWKMTPACKM